MRLIELVVQQSFTEVLLPESLLGSPALDLLPAHAHQLIVVVKSDVPDFLIRQRYGPNQYDRVLVMSCDIWPQQFTHEQLLDVFAEGVQNLGFGQETCFFVSRTDIGLNDVISGLACMFGGYACGTVEQVSIDAEKNIVLKKTGFGGRLYLHQKISERLIFLMLRYPGSSSAQVCRASVECVWNRLEFETETACSSAFFLPIDEAQVNLTDSPVIVAGGRGMRPLDSFDLLYELAAEIGGVVAASLPAVDAGWASVTRQVGQSGQYVKPDLYIAFGIAGTSQHMAGIDPLTKIYAVNNDKDAAIFKAAQIGVLESCEAFLPLLLRELRLLKQSLLIDNSDC